jgi:hypothetical protein
MINMANENLKKALEKAMIPEYDELLLRNEKHVFSVEFERKMQKLIKRRNKPYYKIINTVGKRVACIVVIVLIASSVTVLSVDALRNAVADFFVSTYDKFSSVQPVEDDIAPSTIKDIYEITYDLKEYEIYYEDNTEYRRNITYIKDDILINFSQYTKDAYDINVNTEGSEITTIDINNYEAVYFLDNHNYNHLIFDNGEYIIYISSNISKNALINIAESVKKIE